jgi:CBS domain-containing protein
MYNTYLALEQKILNPREAVMSDTFNVRGMLANKKRKELLSIPPDAAVIQALDAMREAKVGALLVMEGEKLVGIVTERDYAWKVELESKKAATTKVAEIMTPVEKVISVNTFTSLEDCLNRMDENHIRHLPVIDKGVLLGMISSRDVMGGIVRSQIFQAQYLLEPPGGRV